MSNYLGYLILLFCNDQATPDYEVWQCEHDTYTCIEFIQEVEPEAESVEAFLLCSGQVEDEA